MALLSVIRCWAFRDGSMDPVDNPPYRAVAHHDAQIPAVECGGAKV